ncbi:MAG TPA: serine hydrolase domain-containing protein [Microlunatus sp.]|nr:serine hydrolase domain-containing protein [Microlunatus sp.]
MLQMTDTALSTSIDAGIDAIMRRHAAVGIAVGVVRDGELDTVRSRGLADMDRGTPVTSETVFRIGSITKTFTAVAIMQLAEHGRIDLDAPAARYLRSYALVPFPPGDRPASVRHLLTHTAGIPEVIRASNLVHRLFGETVPIGAEVPPLAEFYRDGLKCYAEPGTRFSYSDHNFTTLGQIVEDVTGQSLESYLDEHLFAVLGMTSTGLRRDDRLRARLARGYTIGRHGPRPVKDYELITAAAGGAYSTLTDMARYAVALLDGGANEHGRILSGSSLAAMFEPQYRPDPRVPGIGLSFWRSESDGQLIVDHGGIVPGFNSEMFLAPAVRVGVLAFTNGASRAMFWLPGEVSALLCRIVGASSFDPDSLGPQRPETWPDLCGRYTVRGRLTDLRAREMTGLGIEVLVRRGRLVLRLLTPVRALYRGLPLLPDRSDPDAFWLDLRQYDIGLARVVFSREPGLGVTALHLDILPMSADKRPRRAGRSSRS